MKYHVKPFYFYDNHNSLFDFIQKSTFYSFYKNYLSKKRFSSPSDLAGLILLDNEKIIGSTLLITHYEKGLIIGNISCTFISDNYRGQALSSLLINETTKLCDVVLELTALDPIIKLIKKNTIRNFKPISHYQMWINPFNIKNKNNAFKIINIACYDSLIKENINNSVSFLSFSNQQEKITIGFYSFKRFYINVVEVIFVDNIACFVNNRDTILKILSKKTKCNLIFMDGAFDGNKRRFIKARPNKRNKLFYLFNLLLIAFRKQLILENRKYYWIKNNNLVWDVNFLSTEYCFYK